MHKVNSNQKNEKLNGNANTDTEIPQIETNASDENYFECKWHGTHHSPFNKVFFIRFFLAHTILFFFVFVMFGHSHYQCSTEMFQAVFIFVWNDSFCFQQCFQWLNIFPFHLWKDLMRASLDQSNWFEVEIENSTRFDDFLFLSLWLSIFMQFFLAHLRYIVEEIWIRIDYFRWKLFPPDLRMKIFSCAFSLK